MDDNPFLLTLITKSICGCGKMHVEITQETIRMMIKIKFYFISDSENLQGIPLFKAVADTLDDTFPLFNINTTTLDTCIEL